MGTNRITKVLRDLLATITARLNSRSRPLTLEGFDSREDTQLLDMVAETIDDDHDTLVHETERHLADQAARRRQAITGAYEGGTAKDVFMDPTNTLHEHIGDDIVTAGGDPEPPPRPPQR